MTEARAHACIHCSFMLELKQAAARDRKTHTSTNTALHSSTRLYLLNIPHFRRQIIDACICMPMCVFLMMHLTLVSFAAIEL